MIPRMLAALALVAAFGSAAVAQGNPQSAPGNVSGRAAPHIDGTTGGGPEIHRPVPVFGQADARQAPHLDNQSDGPVPHQPGPEPCSANAGPAPHLDNTTDGPTPHTGTH